MSTTRSATEEILLAEQCDANGAHDDAIDALARATTLGSIEATTRLAKRLITGDRAPLLPSQGTGFLIEAVNRGGAEAAAKLAVLVAAGVYIEPSLPYALRLVTLAAERGWHTAQTQLLALTPDAELASLAEREPVAADHWQRLAQSVDLKQWTSSPAGQTLHESPLIRSFESFVPDRVCDWLMDFSRGRLARALVYDAVGGRDIATRNRTNSWAQFDLMSSELTHLLVQLRMQAACGIPLHNMEANAILHYAVGEESTNHYDFVSPETPGYEAEIAKNGQRVLTFLVYLNDDYEGGLTDFVRLGLAHKGRRGEGLFFVNSLENNEPDLRTLHAGRPPTRGQKWIVSQFIRGRRVLGAAS